MKIGYREFCGCCRAARRSVAHKRSVALFAIAAISLTSACGDQSQPAVPHTSIDSTEYTTESPSAFDARMKWWRDSRFGLFIHWGAYAVLSGQYEGETTWGTAEWIMNTAAIPVAEYEQYAAQFNPIKFDAAEWVRIARDAGMKYIIITSKHHEGFAMWDSSVSEYDVMNASPYSRDILGELSVAAREAGIPLGFYYSIMDWHHPDAQAPHYPEYNSPDKSNPNFQRYMDTYLKPQIREIIEQYDPAVLWFDGEWIPEYTHEMGQDMYTFVRTLNPDVLVNNRVDVGRKGMQGMNLDDQSYAGDFGTPEQEILDGTSVFDWESCMTMNDTWGYRSTDDNWKSEEVLIHNLVDIVAKGGNYLLNVGPTPEGEFQSESVDRLKAMGDWLAVNGEAIYGSRPWTTHGEGDSIRYTRASGPNLYAISLGWPGERLRLRFAEPAPDSEIYMLGDDRPLSWTYEKESGLVISLPPRLQNDLNRRGRHAFVFKIVIDGT